VIFNEASELRKYAICMPVPKKGNILDFGKRKKTTSAPVVSHFPVSLTSTLSETSYTAIADFVCKKSRFPANPNLLLDLKKTFIPPSKPTIWSMRRNVDAGLSYVRDDLFTPKLGPIKRNLESWAISPDKLERNRKIKDVNCFMTGFIGLWVDKIFPPSIT
jgi:hypothetical protein